MKRPATLVPIAAAVTMVASCAGVKRAQAQAAPPMVALAGAGVPVMVVAVVSAVAGTWLYGYLRPRLPH